VVAVVRIDQSQSIILLAFDCDWSILTTTITYDYVYAITESVLRLRLKFCYVWRTLCGLLPSSPSYLHPENEYLAR